MGKPRTLPNDSSRELQRRLQEVRQAGQFEVHCCSIADLQVIGLLGSRKRLGKGEFTSIAFAMSRGLAVLTDDQGAKKLSANAGVQATQTTPPLHDWLIFTRRLDDADHCNVVSQHQQMEGMSGSSLQEA